jgi:hypothetical protein
MTEYAYTFRKWLFGADTTYIVHNDALVMRRAGNVKTTIPLTDIRSVQLVDEGGNTSGVPIYACIIRTTRRKFVIRSASVVRTDTAQSHAAEYRGFVRALLRALQPHADSVQFIQGSRSVRILALTIVILGPIMILAVGLSLYLHATGSVGNLMKLLALIPTIPAILIAARRGPPRMFDPAAVPEEYLPQEPAE